QFAGHVFQRMHRAVDAAGEQRLFDLLDELALAPDAAQGPVSKTVAGRGDGDQVNLEAGVVPLQRRLHPARLRHGETATARADAPGAGQGSSWGSAMPKSCRTAAR